MAIKKLFSLCLVMCMFFSMHAYSQEGVLTPPELPQEGIATVEEEIPYVKPGNVTVNFKDADIRAVLNYLSEVSGVDIVPSPDVSGTITLKLTNKPWEVALDIIVKNYGFAYEREGDIIRVITLGSLRLEELSTEVIPLNYASAENAQDAVKDMLTERGKMTYDSRVNALVITDLATNIYKIRKVVENLDQKTPQIMIEAKIIETTLNKTERMGIDWNLVIAASGAARPTTFPWTSWNTEDVLPRALQNFYPFVQTGQDTVTLLSGADPDAAQTQEATDFTTTRDGNVFDFPLATASDFAYGTLNFSQFSVVLEYLKQRADTDVIATPRITTLNNRSAKMFVGRVHPYISEYEVDDDGTIKYKYKEKEIGIRLEVTPHINANADIDVKIKPEIKDMIGFQKMTEFFSLPVFSTREAETQVMVKDGDTVFIGGLIKESIMDGDKRFPILGDLLGDVPFVGNLFKYSTESKVKTELVFFLTVHVVKSFDELNELAIQKATGKGIINFAEENELNIEKEVFVEMPGPVKNFTPKKKHKPLIDFTKPKKK